MLDYFDPANKIFIITEDRADESLRHYVESRGPLAGDLLKAIVTQLFGALASIFMAGLAHLRVCDETLWIEPQSGQLTIKGFQDCWPYGQEKKEELYAPIDVRPGGEGVWRAPETIAEGEYNARKAVIWSCGVAIVGPCF